MARLGGVAVGLAPRTSRGLRGLMTPLPTQVTSQRGDLLAVFLERTFSFSKEGRHDPKTVT